MEVDINCTANRREFLADMNSWDVYASAMVTAPSGDPSISSPPAVCRG